MKTVAAGENYATVTVDTEEEVKFSFPSPSLSVEVLSGEITVALTDTARAGDDGTLTIPKGETQMFIHHRPNIDTYYLTGSGTAKLCASIMGDVNPFEGKGKGGDGGTYSETVLYSANAPHKTNVELSQPYTNFDAIVIIWKYSDISSRSDYTVRYETTKLTSQMNANDEVVIWEGDIMSNAYRVEDSTHLNFTTSYGTLYSYLAEVIGIKY